MNKKSKKHLILSLKILISLLAFLFVFYKIYSTNDIQNFSIEFSFENFLLILILLILMIFNWSIETIKWKYTIKNIENIKFMRAFKAVWTGITIGTITPNRVGEFGGRIIFLQKDNQRKAIAPTLFADLSQLITTLIFGIIGFFILIQNINFSNSELFNKRIFIIIITVFIILILFLIYFYFDFICKKFKKINFLQKYISDDRILTNKKIFILFFSMFRFLIFNFQFYLALKIFGIEISLINSLLASSAMYLCSTIIPNLPFIEIGLRASFSIIFFGLFTINITAIIFATLLIYGINVVIPIIVGSIFMFCLKGASKN